MYFRSVLAFCASAGCLTFAQEPKCDTSDADLEQMTSQTLSSLQTLGYTVLTYDFKVFNTTLFGANPGNPYVVYTMPLPTWRMPDERDAILFLGCTPSKTRYFGWRSYLGEYDGRVVFASLGDTLNNLVINTTGDDPNDVYEKTTAVVTTADKHAFSDVSNALEASGLAGAINLDSIDTTLVDHRKLSTFVMLHRASVWDDEAAKQAYFAQTRPIYYLKAPTGQAPSPLPPAPLRKRGTGESEDEMPGVSSGVMDLRKGLAEGWASSRQLEQKLSLTFEDFPLDGFECIANCSNCYGDNRDTNYIQSGYFPLEKGYIAVIFGSNCVANGKCTYANLGIYKERIILDMPASTNLTVDDREFFDSAKYFVPELSDDVASKLFAYAFARDCSGVSYCLTIPESEIGLSTQALGVYRTYLEPMTQSGPLVSELIMPNLLLFGESSKSVI